MAMIPPCNRAMVRDILIETQRYRARFASGDDDLARALGLRRQVFRAGRGADDDAFDPLCRHILVEDSAGGDLVCACRVLELSDSVAIATSYAAQFYGLDALAGYGGPMLELGRFCVAPGVSDGDVLRVAWAALTKLVDAAGVTMLFGCSSFPGVDSDAYGDAFALLAERHLAPLRWRPEEKATERVSLTACAPAVPNPKRALKTLPPLLRTYLIMGGWVSDHAVIDRDLGTLHVFTGLEVAAVPPARARALRDLARA